MKKNPYTPEQAERIEEVWYKLKYALDCLDDLRAALAVYNKHLGIHTDPSQYNR